MEQVECHWCISSIEGVAQPNHGLSGQPMQWECGASAPSRMDLWRLAGRYLEVHVALGPTAGPDRIGEVKALLNSLVEAVDAFA